MSKKEIFRVPVSISKDIFISIIVITFIFFMFDFIQNWIDIKLTNLHFIQIIIYIIFVVIFLIIILILRKKIEWIRSGMERRNLIVSIELSFGGGFGTKLFILLPELILQFSLGRMIISIIISILFLIILSHLIIKSKRSKGGEGDEDWVVEFQPEPPDEPEFI